MSDEDEPASGPALPQGVGRTALITAYARAQETRLVNRLFDDHVAALIISEALGVPAHVGATLPRFGPAREDGSSEVWAGLYALLTGRTPFYDRHLAERVTAGCRQIVILGAGMDARAFRLPPDPHCTVYEIDTAAVLSFKANVVGRNGVEPTVRRVPVDTDLREDWMGALNAAGFGLSLPTAWLAEGLLMYLTPPQADALLSAITAASAPGSTFGGEYLNRKTRVDDVPVLDDDEHTIVRMYVSSDHGRPEMTPSTWLAAHGWRTCQTDLSAELTLARRDTPAMSDPGRPDPLHLYLFTATLTTAPSPGTSSRSK
jgi:methyltransferase (TIGR00027 family)